VERRNPSFDAHCPGRGQPGRRPGRPTPPTTAFARTPQRSVSGHLPTAWPYRGAVNWPSRCRRNRRPSRGSQWAPSRGRLFRCGCLRPCRAWARWSAHRSGPDARRSHPRSPHP